MSRQFSYFLGHRHADSLKYLPAAAEALAADGKLFPVVVQGDLLKRIQILLDVGPLEGLAGLLQSAIQFLAENPCEKAAEDMPSNGFIDLVVDGAGFQYRLHVPS